MVVGAYNPIRNSGFKGYYKEIGWELGLET